MHCASLNFFIAMHIKQKKYLSSRLILTGDCMNEIFADYTFEMIDAERFYEQPNIPKKAKQRFLLRGLDSSDRELGVFSYFGLSAVQPYVLTIEHYKRLSEEEFSAEDAKYMVNGPLLPQSLLARVGKNKVRAQAGDNSGGILGHFVRNGLRADNLRNQFISAFNCSEDFLNDFILAGRYRT